MRGSGQGWNGGQGVGGGRWVPAGQVIPTWLPFPDSEDHENLLRNGVTHILSIHNRATPVLEVRAWLGSLATTQGSRSWEGTSRSFSWPGEKQCWICTDLHRWMPGDAAQRSSVDMTYLCISASDSSSQNLLQHFKECIQFIHECRLGGGACLVHCLAGVSRSSTVLVAYLMTVTELGWQSCLAATRAVRSYASPNSGFQQQLQEYQSTLLPQYRAWIRRDYGRNPFQDQQELQQLLGSGNPGLPSGCPGTLAGVRNPPGQSPQRHWL
ncbi:Dual specificity protein phosphatase 22-A [Lonchura striata]|uniref:Dual specificity protein phosphatase 22-A n=1 Tax=Lonchura striata TaxID=40157 RepID=A0A218UHP9_9PASE|nr:Dual specificity protein phosphatase 22-A [Lonchura striata domestica]